MTALVVIGWILAYLAVGAIYARSQILGTYQRARQEYTYGDIVRDAVLMTTVMRTLCWPGFLPVDMFRGPVAQWMYRPITSRKERAAQLREDARVWREKRYSGTPAEQQMAAELARLCDQQADEVDL